MKSTLQDTFEFKTPYRFFDTCNLQYVKKLVGFYLNSLHRNFKFFTKHPTSKNFLFFYLRCIYSSLQCLLRLREKAKKGICRNAF